MYRKTTKLLPSGKFAKPQPNPFKPFTFIKNERDALLLLRDFITQNQKQINKTRAIVNANAIKQDAINDAIIENFLES